MNVFDEILGAIDVLVSKKIKNISFFDFCTVIEVNNKNCKVIYNGNQHILPYYGNTPVANNKYPILPNISFSFLGVSYEIFTKLPNAAQYIKGLLLTIITSIFFLTPVNIHSKSTSISLENLYIVPTSFVVPIGQ